MQSTAKTLIREFSRKIVGYPEEERGKILSALRWAEGLHHKQLRVSGEPYLVHPLTVAEILVDSHLDFQTVIAAILHDALEDTGLSSRELRKEYGKEISSKINKGSMLKQAEANWKNGESDINLIVLAIGSKPAIFNLNYQTKLSRVKRVSTVV